jgi:lipopolysaccharide transport system ATP-binding protein
LRGGQVAAYGDAEVVVGQYTVEMSTETQRRTPTNAPAHFTATGQELNINKNRFGSLEMEIVDVRLLDANQLPILEIATGDRLSVEISYTSPRPIDAPIFGVTISSDDRDDYVDVSSDNENVDMPQLQGQGRIYLHFGRIDLNAGQYYIDVGVYAANWAYAYDYHWHVYPFSITSGRKTKGLLSPPRQWTLEPI